MPNPSQSARGRAKLPRWAKGLAAVVGIVAALVVVMVFAGHGPGQHMPAGDAPTTGSGAPPG